jgi:hypothetical protein
MKRLGHSQYLSQVPFYQANESENTTVNTPVFLSNLAGVTPTSLEVSLDSSLVSCFLGFIASAILSQPIKESEKFS